MSISGETKIQGDGRKFLDRFESSLLGISDRLLGFYPISNHPHKLSSLSALYMEYNNIHVSVVPNTIAFNSVFECRLLSAPLLSTVASPNHTCCVVDVLPGHPIAAVVI